MIDHEKFVKILKYYSDVMPRYAPDFSNPNVLYFWHQEFGELDIHSFKSAMDDMVRQMDHFPNVKDVNAALGRVILEDEEISREVSARIISAITKYGGWNHVEAKEYMGEVARQVVDMFGGWTHVCDSITNNNLPTYSAQFRNLATTLIKKNRSGITGPPSLPECKNNRQSLQEPLSGALSIAMGHD